jgi:hypothetical protein
MLGLQRVSGLKIGDQVMYERNRGTHRAIVAARARQVGDVESVGRTAWPVTLLGGAPGRIRTCDTRFRNRVVIDGGRVARRFRVSPMSVSRWRRAFDAGGVDALASKGPRRCDVQAHRRPAR